MEARLRSWWQYIREHRIAAIITAFVVVIVFIFAGYWFGWTGFNGDTIIWQVKATKGASLPTRLEEQQPAKVLWDWLQLLFIPAILTSGAIWLTTRQNHDREISLDNQREAALQVYIDQMSELLLHEHLRDTGPDDEVRNIARVRTLVVLANMDGQRKEDVFQFLYESKLISKDQPVISLNGANLSGINQAGANLSRTNLSRTNLNGANFIGTSMSESDLSGADLIEVNLSKSELRNANLASANLLAAILKEADFDGADLSKTDLSHAQLEGVNFSDANLKSAKGFTNEELEKQAKSLKGAIMPDGSKHP
jgi:uncharacterized protein YjbI with pentapeptide repeats